jgi:competence protein ComEC
MFVILKIWSQIPFLRVLIPFILGILFGIYFGFQNTILWYVLISLALVISFFFVYSKLFTRYRTSWVFGILINTLFIIFGFQLTVFNTGKFSSNHFSNYSDRSQFQLIKVYQQPVEKEKIFKLFAKVEKVKCNDKWIKTSGNILIVLPKDSLSSQIRYGDYLIVSAKIEKTKPPMNPGEFDYKKYLSYQSVYDQTYLSPDSWVKTGDRGGNPVSRLACNMQTELLNVFKKYVSGKRELAVISALILGDTDGIDSDLMNAYAGTGAIHVLSVSGMHVGLILIALNFLLFFMNKNKLLRILKAIIIICFLIFYAILTGLSPAVMRSAIMLSLIIAGITFNKSHNILNAMAFSAFVLLLYDPFLITNVGFLLSYFAIGGIVVFHKYFYRLFEFNNSIIDKIWSATCAAFAAELGTFPIAILFFHQFPVYFWFSNLFVWLLTPLIMFAGIGLLITTKFTTISFYGGKLVGILVYLLNKSVLVINNLPFSKVKGISITPLESLLLYLSIAFLFYFLLKRRVLNLILGIISLVMVFSIQFYQDFVTMNQRKMVIYDIHNHSGMDLVDGHKNIFIADKDLISNQSLINFHLSGNRGAMKVNNLVESDNNLFIRDNYIQFFNKRILVIKSKKQLEESSPIYNSIDYLILEDNADVTMDELQELFGFKLLIIDSSNSNNQSRRWKKECLLADINVYSTIDSGAFIADIL